MRAHGKLVAGVLATLLLQGCATLQAPPYEPSYENVTLAKQAFAEQVVVGAFTGGPVQLSARGSKVISSLGSNFADYVQGALSSELRRAEALLPGSEWKLQGTLLATDLDASGISEGEATIATEFVLTQAGAERYRRRHEARHTWESSFVGGVAIPRAVRAYPKVVEFLFRKLYGDPDFVKAFGRTPEKAP